MFWLFCQNPLQQFKLLLAWTLHLSTPLKQVCFNFHSVVQLQNIRSRKRFRIHLQKHCKVSVNKIFQFLFSALPKPPPCIDSKGWNNFYGQNCKHYEKNNWCKNGVVHNIRFTGIKYNHPTQNCCACGKRMHMIDWNFCDFFRIQKSDKFCFLGWVGIQASDVYYMIKKLQEKVLQLEKIRSKFDRRLSEH